jgi:hypothetical protein
MPCHKGSDIHQHDVLQARQLQGARLSQFPVWCCASQPPARVMEYEESRNTFGNDYHVSLPRSWLLGDSMTVSDACLAMSSWSQHHLMLKVGTGL